MIKMVVGSIASVDSKALESRAVPDVSNMLTGQVTVNGKVAKAADAKVSENDIVAVKGVEICYKKFVERLKEQGYEQVELIDTTKGMFMSPKEAKWLMLRGSALIVGKK